MLVEQACMGSSYPNERIKSLAAGAVLLLSLSLGGCASSNSSWMNARAEGPTASKEYLPVEDLPSQKPAMTVDEQSKLKKQLIDARDRQSAAAKARVNNSGN